MRIILAGLLLATAWLSTGAAADPLTGDITKAQLEVITMTTIARFAGSDGRCPRFHVIERAVFQDMHDADIPGGMRANCPSKGREKCPSAGAARAKCTGTGPPRPKYTSTGTARAKCPATVAPAKPRWAQLDLAGSDAAPCQAPAASADSPLEQTGPGMILEQLCIADIAEHVQATREKRL